MSNVTMQSTSFGKPIPVYDRYKILEDATKDAGSAETLYAGMPVTLCITATATLAAGEVMAMATNVKVYGLSKVNKNIYSDEVTGASSGMYGSGMATVIIEGIVDLQHNIFPLSDGSEVTVKTYDDAQTYHVFDKLFVELANGAKLGQITNVAVAGNNATFIGFCLVPPTSTSTTMQILLRCGLNESK